MLRFILHFGEVKLLVQGHTAGYLGKFSHMPPKFPKETEILIVIQKMLCQDVPEILHLHYILPLFLDSFQIVLIKTTSIWKVKMLVFNTTYKKVCISIRNCKCHEP